MSNSAVFSTVMWTPSDKYGPLVTRRRGSGTAPHAIRGTQPCAASTRRGSVDARARSTFTKSCAAPAVGYRAEPERREAKSVRWLVDDYKFQTEEPKVDSTRMPVPVPVTKTSTAKSNLYPPACRPFELLDLPVYHPDDVRSELTKRLVKTLNDIGPLGQVHPILSPACVHVQHELISITHELADISSTRLAFIADNIPDHLRRIRRLTNNILATSAPATQYEADRLQELANATRQIRKSRIGSYA